MKFLKINKMKWYYCFFFIHISRTYFIFISVYYVRWFSRGLVTYTFVTLMQGKNILTVSVSFVGSISTRSNEIISYPNSGNKTKYGISFATRRAMPLKLGGAWGSQRLNTTFSPARGYKIYLYKIIIWYDEVDFKS